MKVGYYESRQNSKQVSYIKFFNPMHGCEVIKCMKSRDFSANLQSQDNMENRSNGKNTMGQNRQAQKCTGKGALEGLLTLAMGLAQ